MELLPQNCHGYSILYIKSWSKIVLLNEEFVLRHRPMQCLVLQVKVPLVY